MAIFRTVSPKGHYKDDNVYQNGITYITNPDKAPHEYILAQGVHSIGTAAQDMKALTEFYGKDHGTRIRHMILSFDPREPIGCREAFDIEKQMMDFFAPDYQMVGAIHVFGKHHLHIHFIMNPVRISDGKKYKGKRADFYELLQCLKRLLRKYGVTCYYSSCKEHFE